MTSYNYKQSSCLQQSLLARSNGYIFIRSLHAMNEALHHISKQRKMCFKWSQSQAICIIPYSNHCKVKATGFSFLSKSVIENTRIQVNCCNCPSIMEKTCLICSLKKNKTNRSFPLVSTFVCEIQYVENEENIDKWWIWMSHYHNEMDSSSTTAYVQTHVQCNILLPYGLQMSFFEILATYNVVNK